jgi:stage II sporulation protein D
MGGAPWSRLAGENVTLYSLRPDQDRDALAVAGDAVREMERRTGLHSPAAIELRVYPDAETFRNVTGEPGWVLARTNGKRVDLQPTQVLRSTGALESTIRYEILHVFLDVQAAPDLPVWFRQGLAEYLRSGAAHPSNSSVADVRTLSGETRAPSAKAAAAVRVGEMVRREGLQQVISWFKAGLPN